MRKSSNSALERSTFTVVSVVLAMLVTTSATGIVGAQRAFEEASSGQGVARTQGGARVTFSSLKDWDLKGENLSPRGHEAGFTYDHPDEVEADIRARLDSITRGGTIPVDAMSAEQRDGLKKLQDYERSVAIKNYDLQQRIIDPVEERILKYLYPRGVK
jgi:hypothetical protein